PASVTLLICPAQQSHEFRHATFLAPKCKDWTVPFQRPAGTYAVCKWREATHDLGCTAHLEPISQKVKPSAVPSTSPVSVAQKPRYSPGTPCRATSCRPTLSSVPRSPPAMAICVRRFSRGYVTATANAPASEPAARRSALDRSVRCDPDA